MAGGARLRWDSDSGEYRIQHYSDIETFKNVNEMHRRKEEELGIRKDAGFRFIGSIPFTVVMEIKEKHGIDLTNLRDKTERRKAFRIIERDYPLLKGTNMRIG